MGGFLLFRNGEMGSELWSYNSDEFEGENIYCALKLKDTLLSVLQVDLMAQQL